MKNNGIMIITALPRPFLSLHVTGNKHSINGGLTVGSLKAFPFFGIGGSRLKSELPTWLAAADRWHIDPL